MVIFHNLLYVYQIVRSLPQIFPKKRLGHGIRVIGAPQPTEVLWENQDVPWWSRLLRCHGEAWMVQWCRNVLNNPRKSEELTKAIQSPRIWVCCEVSFR